MAKANLCGNTINIQIADNIALQCPLGRLLTTESYQDVRERCNVPGKVAAVPKGLLM